VSLTMAWAACSAPTSFKPFHADTQFSQLSARLQLVHARARRRFQRGLKRKPLGLIKKLRKAKKEAAPNEKPATVKTHLRDMIIVPEMIGSVCGVYVSLKTLERMQVSRALLMWCLRESHDARRPQVLRALLTIPLLPCVLYRTESRSPPSRSSPR
jgi:ribosomal protein uS19